MVKNIFIILFLSFFALVSLYSTELTNDDIVLVIKEIADTSEKTATNTTQNSLEEVIWDDVLLLISGIISGVVSCGAVYTVFKFLVKNRVGNKMREKLFLDLIRHFYRNVVVLAAVLERLEEEGFDKFYPSEQHILKLEIPEEDVTLNEYSNTSKYKDLYHQQELRLRNRNIEVDSLLNHIKNPLIPAELKKKELVYVMKRFEKLTDDLINLAEETMIPLSREKIIIWLVNRSTENTKGKSGYRTHADGVDIQAIAPIEQDSFREFDDKDREIAYNYYRRFNLSHQLFTDIESEKSGIMLFPYT